MSKGDIQQTKNKFVLSNDTFGKINYFNKKKKIKTF